ncbi:MAG: alpha/beta fold hydrolase [Clostridia bacterium]|nr:alpha/beta fold hydrolase [Lachnospiraceae bacterium]NCC01355.1 alpha/beta fold hydrolase [Clostridia bacterium]NCD03981.1 alpha/beta fold hydrolase [Clostridia bacterium]
MKKRMLGLLLIGSIILASAGCSSAPTATTAAETESSDLTESLTEIDLALPVAGHEGWELPGTLTLPEGDGPFPAVVLVHGSGPNDRDETIYQNKPFRDLANTLAQKGIAVYRYDKRTNIYGQDMVSDINLTLEDETVIDAANALALLKEQPDIDSSRIFVLGHSLGGDALPRINQLLADSGNTAAGYIFFAAPARQLSDIMREQYDYIYSLMPVLTNDQQAQKEEAYSQLDRLQELDSLDDSKPILGAYPAYWKYLRGYDQVQTADAITSPCLVLQGEEDYQVTMEDFNIWKGAYGDRENWTFKSYAGLTHLFTPGKKENASAAYLKAQTVDTRVIADIADFITTH